MSAIIRTATPTDAFGIATVRVETWRATYRGLIPQQTLDRLDVQIDAERHKENISRADPTQRVFVAEVPGPTIAGFCVGGQCREKSTEYSGELYAIYVLPQYQGQGIGKALLQALSAWLANQGHHRMILYVLRDNIPSRRFYEASGGKVVHEKMIEIGGQALVEVGYGFDLSKFTR